MSFKDIAGLCIIGVKRSRSLTAKAAWVATLAEHEEDEHLVLLKRALWWDTALQKRVPVLSGGPGLWRNGKFYGLRSDYARNHEDHSLSLSPQEYMEHFRWAREDIPRLVAALRMPQRIITRSGCAVDGEEALLIFLKVRSCLRGTQV